LPSAGPSSKHLLAGEFVHLDICAYKQTSYWNNRYFLLVKDDLTGYRKVYFLKKKSEAYDKFLRFENELKLETGNAVRKIRMDPGSKFLSGQFKEMMVKRGIIPEYATK